MKDENLNPNLILTNLLKNKKLNQLDFELKKGKNSGEAIDFNFKDFIEKMELEYRK